MDKNKEFVCRPCAKFLNSSDLKNGKCPECNNDDGVFLNELKSDCETNVSDDRI